MNNPFDLENYKPQINMKDIEKSRRSAYQSSRIVNQKRKQGIEPSQPFAQRSMAHEAGLPQNYTIEMPVMPMHKRSIQKRTKGNE